MFFETLPQVFTVTQAVGLGRFNQQVYKPCSPWPRKEGLKITTTANERMALSEVLLSQAPKGVFQIDRKPELAQSVGDGLS